MIRVGIVGHRYFGHTETITFVARQCSDILKQAQAAHSDVIALSAIAVGADTLFAEAALALGIRLEIVRPFEDYTSDFTSILAQERYDRLHATVRSETKLTYMNRSDEAYLAAMNWVVGHSDVLVAVWDGFPGVGLGTTSDAVKQAIQISRPWIHLNVVDLSVTFYSVKPTLNIVGKDIHQRVYR